MLSLASYPGLGMRLCCPIYSHCIEHYCLCSQGDIALPVCEQCLFSRRSLRRGESVKYLIPDAVIDYIKEHNLYQVTSWHSSIVSHYRIQRHFSTALPLKGQDPYALHRYIITSHVYTVHMSTTLNGSLYYSASNAVMGSK